MACQAASAVSLIHRSNLEAQQGLQLPHDSPLRSLSKLAGADLVLVRKEPRRPSSLISDDSDDSEASQPTKQRQHSSSNSDPTSNLSQKRRLQRPSERRSRSPSRLDRSHTAPPQTQFDLSVKADDCAQSQHSSTHSSEDDEQMSTTAEYREWPMHGFFKRTMIGNEIRYGMEFSLEQLHELCALVCPHASRAGSSIGPVDSSRPPPQAKKTGLGPTSQTKGTRFTQEEDAKLIDTKEIKRSSWDEIEGAFPGRTRATLQVHYYTKLKNRASLSRKRQRANRRSR